MERILFLLGRVLLGVLFLLSGVSKVRAVGLDAVGDMIAVGEIPADLAIPIAIFEIVAGLLVILGLFTRYAAYALALFSAYTAWAYHLGDPVQLMQALAIAGGFLLLAVAGAGTLSLDARRGAF